jgi:hypothetical protein
MATCPFAYGGALYTQTLNNNIQVKKGGLKRLHHL